jgi:predicted TIM-barrel fold metal-dependent hydrolase
MNRMFTASQRLAEIDWPYYRSEIAPHLPDKLLDFHTHVWQTDQWHQGPASSAQATADSASLGKHPAARYMATQISYPIDQLLADAKAMFPDKTYQAVCFGQPTPAVDLAKTNRYLAENKRPGTLYPLRVTGKNLLPKDQLKNELIQGGFWGYKVFLDWIGDDYGSILPQDMLGSQELELAHDHRLVVLLHVPGARRLADPAVQKGVRNLALAYPDARFVLAHCGRCYLPSEMKAAIGSIESLPNVYLDTSMVMDSSVLHLVFSHIDASRVLFATDLPVAAMRGRRVRVMDHWVDVVLEGYPASAYRVASHDIRASFMAYEIVLAIVHGAEAAGLSQQVTRAVFSDNGRRLLDAVRRPSI